MLPTFFLKNKTCSNRAKSLKIVHKSNNIYKKHDFIVDGSSHPEAFCKEVAGLRAEACNFIKILETLAQVLSCELYEISKNTFLTEHLRRLLLDGTTFFIKLHHWLFHLTNFTMKFHFTFEITKSDHFQHYFHLINASFYRFCTCYL